MSSVLLTLGDVADRLSTSTTTILRLVQSGDFIRPVRFQQSAKATMFWFPEDIDNFLDGLKKKRLQEIERDLEEAMKPSASSPAPVITTDTPSSSQACEEKVSGKQSGNKRGRPKRKGNDSSTEQDGK